MGEWGVEQHDPHFLQPIQVHVLGVMVHGSWLIAGMYRTPTYGVDSKPVAFSMHCVVSLLVSVVK